MNKWKGLLLIMAMIMTVTSCTSPETKTTMATEGTSWNVGFARRQIIPDPDSTEPLYIAGYNNGLEISGVLDYCEARAVWLDTGGNGILLIGIDCIALDSGSIAQIREALSDIPNCAAINVYATHTHAGPDTLGLWGPIGVNGKNSSYMDALLLAAEEAGREAASNVHPGSLYYGKAETEFMFRDSRDPQVFDSNLYQIRFASNDGSQGLRMFFYGSHAESLRGDNSLLSRDFPGQLCDRVTEATGDNTLFAAAAAGGLIMTKEFVPNISKNAVQNLQITSDKLVDYALSITPETERELSPSIKWSREVFTVPLDNPVFLLYKTLGILNNDAVKGEGATGYSVRTELCVLMLDDLAVTLIPGEPFPELINGRAYGDTQPDAVNPAPLSEIAAKYGIEEIITIGLANDELGYIVPPTDFLLNEDKPYLERTLDYKGEDHYEETNSVGPKCADKVAEAFEKALDNLK